MPSKSKVCTRMWQVWNPSLLPKARVKHEAIFHHLSEQVQSILGCQTCATMATASLLCLQAGTRDKSCFAGAARRRSLSGATSSPSKWTTTPARPGSLPSRQDFSSSKSPTPSFPTLEWARPFYPSLSPIKRSRCSPEQASSPRPEIDLRLSYNCLVAPPQHTFHMYVLTLASRSYKIHPSLS